MEKDCDFEDDYRGHRAHHGHITAVVMITFWGTDRTAK